MIVMHTNAGWADDGSKHMQLNRNKLVKMAANIFTWSQVKSALVTTTFVEENSWLARPQEEAADNSSMLSGKQS